MSDSTALAAHSLADTVQTMSYDALHIQKQWQITCLSCGYGLTGFYKVNATFATQRERPVRRTTPSYEILWESVLILWSVRVEPTSERKPARPLSRGNWKLFTFLRRLTAYDFILLNLNLNLKNCLFCNDTWPFQWHLLVLRGTQSWSVSTGNRRMSRPIQCTET